MGKLSGRGKTNLKTLESKTAMEIESKAPVKRSKKIKKFKAAASGMDIESDGETPKIKVPKYKSKVDRKNLISKPKSEMLKTFQSKFDEHKKLFVDGKKLSKGQKKRLENKQRFLKQKYFQEFLKKQQEQGNNATIDLKEFEGALEMVDMQALAQTKKAKPEAMTEKKRMELERKEVARCNQIIQHPQFKANPFQTLKIHLTNTLAKK